MTRRAHCLHNTTTNSFLISFVRMNTSRKRLSSDVVWNLTQTYESTTAQNKEKRTKLLLCMSDGCSELAASCWASNENPDEIWNTCERCQLVEFGGPIYNGDMGKVEKSKSKVDIKTDIDEATNNMREEKDQEQKARLENKIECFDCENSTVITSCIEDNNKKEGNRNEQSRKSKLALDY